MVVIQRAEATEKEAAVNLYQLYMYDLSEYFRDDVDEHGLYPRDEHIVHEDADGQWIMHDVVV
ncbi:MAG: hypothetical protein FWC62_00260 [Firmicutes bacterium]|nr:hypothetical protein [Bacillota bacterium]